MRLLDAVRTRLRGLFRRGRIEQDLDAELTFHVEQQVAENLAAGMRPDEARRAALASVGQPDHIKETYREMQRLPVVETVWRDVRYAVRGLLRAPVFSLVALVTLALGIGANTVIYSVLNAAVLRTVPYADADRLMILQVTIAFPGRGTNMAPWSYPKFEDLRTSATAFSAIEGFVPRDVNLAAVGDAERIKAEIVTGGYFSMLGIPALMGRTIGPVDDNKADPHAVAVISERLWRRMFAADPAIVGRTIRVNREIVTIVGVAPSDFRGESGAAELWVPIAALAPPLMNNPTRLRMRMAHWLNVVARRKPEVTPAAADADLKMIVRRMEETFPSNGPGDHPAGPAWSGVATPLAEAKVDPTIRRSLLILLGSVGFVLLIACANLTSLMLSRAMTRQREIAVRLAIGASRAALIRHVMTEAILLGLLAGMLAVLVAVWGVKALALLQPDGQLGPAAPFVRRMAVEWIDLRDPSTLVFTVGLALTAGLLFGLVPALQTTRLDLGSVMKGDGTGWLTGGRGPRRLTARRALLVFQVALAIVLLVGSGLMLRSLSHALRIHLGFNPDHVLTLRLDPPRSQFEDDARSMLLEALTERLRALPGVDAVAVASNLPTRGQNETTSFRINGVSTSGDIAVHMVGPDYFAALHIPAIKGRLLNDRDTAGSQRVAVINETFARRQFAGEDPIGQRISFGLNGWGDPGQEATIVGIVGDVKYQLVDMPVFFDAYLSYRQRPPIATSFVVRTVGDPLSMVNAVREQIRAVDRTLPPFDVHEMSQLVRDATSRWRFSGVLLTVFAALAMILTAAGIYGMLACSVAARTREIGLRVALGAERLTVVRFVLIEACAVCALGLAIGLPSAAVLARSMQGLLYGVEPLDPATLATVAVVALVTTLVAATLPAWRAANVDPLVALRHE
jgi:putative ABC transport system permease protein